MKKFTAPVFAAAAALVLGAQSAFAAVTIPEALEPDNVAGSVLTAIAPYVVSILTAIVTVTVGLALVRYMKRIPNRLAR